MASAARRHLRNMVLQVMAVDAAAIALYLLTPLRQAEGTVKLGYAAVWTIAILAVVGAGLRRIRGSRRASP